MYDEMRDYQANRCLKAIANMENHGYALTKRMMFAGLYVDEAKQTLETLLDNGAISQKKYDEYCEKADLVPGDNKAFSSIHGFFKRTKKNIYKAFENR